MREARMHLSLGVSRTRLGEEAIQLHSVSFYRIYRMSGDVTIVPSDTYRSIFTNLHCNNSLY
jgi:hypothetical protein